jgi:hypothetical protein
MLLDINIPKLKILYATTYISNQMETSIFFKIYLWLLPRNHIQMHIQRHKAILLYAIPYHSSYTCISIRIYIYFLVLLQHYTSLHINEAAT